MQKSTDKQALFKEALGNYPTGVTIVTTQDENGTPVGLTVNSFASVSLDPLMILWSIDHGVSSLDIFKKADKFAVHVLAGDQQELCKTFASKDTDRFGSCEWKVSEHNLPVIADAFAVLECETFQQVEAGDHTILIGNVLDIDVDSGKDPMLYHRRKFGPIPAAFYK
ncbi:NADH-FMN oxidoreductase RutF, flavin reductase (DIM6/NTAB) family [Alteribacillus persepolensis]|uniref:NADH-FMN oxidoreductase RutF, flavin reductase (DIM6/NTAB) family n=1 Tax=Alteribacillus persepolensis TaxID=568899 RepID=A0A1G8GY81_9BACI|nr:NADH-FMN oxidoreductase RutF, flavin reductase (DIM6/NTAB) family [Alteribacillus persepolensis]